MIFTVSLRMKEELECLKYEWNFYLIGRTSPRDKTTLSHKDASFICSSDILTHSSILKRTVNTITVCITIPKMFMFN